METFCFPLKDDLQTIGGIHGYIYYGAMHIDELWIATNHRNQGLGKKLSSQAEDLARLKHYSFITVNTMSFEAKPFYEKLGYLVEFKREGYSKNSQMYFLRKNLI